MTEAISMFVPIIAIVGSFSIPIIIVTTAIITEYKTNKRRYEAMVKAMELGKNPDEIRELFAIEKKKKDGSGFLKGGIVVAGIGLGFAGMGVVIGEPRVYGPSVFMAILGLALLLIYFLIRPRPKNQ